MSWLGAVVEGVGLIADSVQKSHAAKAQREQLEQARNYATTGPLNDYAKAGSAASKQINDLTGLNGTSTGADTQASRTSFDKYLDSTGYKFNLSQGQAALDASAASKGLTGSGSSLKAAVSFGQNEGASYFDKYLTQLNGTANRGENAATAQTNAYGGLSTNIANSFTNEADAIGKDINKGASDTADYLGFNDKSQDTSQQRTASDPSNTNAIFGGAPASGAMPGFDGSTSSGSSGVSNPLYN